MCRQATLFQLQFASKTHEHVYVQPKKDYLKREDFSEARFVLPNPLSAPIHAAYFAGVREPVQLRVFRVNKGNQPANTNRPI